MNSHLHHGYLWLLTLLDSRDWKYDPNYCFCKSAHAYLTQQQQQSESDWVTKCLSIRTSLLFINRNRSHIEWLAVPHYNQNRNLEYIPGLQNLIIHLDSNGSKDWMNGLHTWVIVEPHYWLNSNCSKRLSEYMWVAEPADHVRSSNLLHHHHTSFS